VSHSRCNAASRTPGHQPGQSRHSRQQRLALPQTWLRHRLAALADNPHHQLLRQFGLWHQIPRLRARAARRPLTEAARRFAGAQFTQADGS
jgi:hypothetical protein